MGQNIVFSLTYMGRIGGGRISEQHSFRLEVHEIRARLRGGHFAHGTWTIISSGILSMSAETDTLYLPASLDNPEDQVVRTYFRLRQELTEEQVEQWMQELLDALAAWAKSMEPALEDPFAVDFSNVCEPVAESLRNMEPMEGGEEEETGFEVPAPPMIDKAKYAIIRL